MSCGKTDNRQPHEASENSTVGDLACMVDRADSCGWVQGTVVGWGQGRTNLFAAPRGDKNAMRLLAGLLWTLVQK